MKSASALALSLSLAYVATACGALPMQSPAKPAYLDVKDNPNGPKRPAIIKRNPNPTAYEITLTIENAPGPFGSVLAAMQYEVLDDSCLPDLGGMSGTRLNLLEWVPVELKHVSGNTYRGLIYDNLLVDEDYYGLGVCHWSLVTAQFKLKAGVTEGETNFSHHLFHDDLVAKKQVRTYYWKGRYPKGNLANIPIPGEEDIATFKPELRDELFALVFDIKNVAP